MTVACKYPNWFLFLEIFCNLALAVLRICASFYYINQVKYINNIMQNTIDK